MVAEGIMRKRLKRKEERMSLPTSLSRTAALEPFMVYPRFRETVVMALEKEKLTNREVERVKQALDKDYIDRLVLSQGVISVLKTSSSTYDLERLKTIFEIAWKNIFEGKEQALSSEHVTLLKDILSKYLTNRTVHRIRRKITVDRDGYLALRLTTLTETITKTKKQKRGGGLKQVRIRKV